MWRAAWRSLVARKRRLFASTFAIVIGVAFVVGTLVFSDTLNSSFTSVFNNSVGDVVVRASGTDSGDDNADSPRQKIEAALVDDLADVPGAARADGRITDFTAFVIDKDGKLYGGQGPPTISVNVTDAPAAGGVRGLAITEGRVPRSNKEVALDRVTAERAGLILGQRIDLVIAAQRALVPATLVGLADFPDGGSGSGASYVLWNTDAAQLIFDEGRDRFDQVWVTAREGVTQAELRDQVAPLLPSGFEAVTGDAAAEESASQLLDAISFLTLFLLAFAGISLVVGSFLIVNTFAMLVAQRSRELALLRAIGASRRQVTRSVLFEAFLVGLIGSTVGVAGGVALAFGIRALFARFGLDLGDTPLIYEPRTFIAGYLVGLLVTMAAAWFPARRSAKIPPVAAMRDDVALPTASIWRRFAAGVVLLGVAGWLMWRAVQGDVGVPAYWASGGILVAIIAMVLVAPVVSRPFLVVVRALYSAGGSVGRLAGENSLRSPRRTAATAAALMIGLALVTTMAIAGASARASVDETVADTFLGDLIVGSQVRQPFSGQIAREAARIEGVDSVTRIRYRRANLVGEEAERARAAQDRPTVGLMGVDEATISSVLRLSLLEGDLADFRDGTVMIEPDDVEEHGWAVGDDITLRMPEGPQRLRVVGILDDSPVLFQPVVTMSTLERGGYDAQDNSLYIALRGDADTFAVQRQLTESVKDLPTVTVFNQQQFAADQRAQIDRLVLMIYALLGLALVVAVLGVVNTLGLSVSERTREIGLLRAVGITRAQLRRMIALESVAISVLGALLGVGLGIVSGLVLMQVAREEGLEVTAVPVPTLAGFVAAATIIGVLAAVLPARRAARLDVLKAIATD